MIDLGGLAIAAGLFIFAALIAMDASSYPARRSYAQFGPEIFPYLIATGIAVFGAVTVVMALRNGFPAREPMNISAVAWVIGGVLAEAVLLYAGTGFLIASGILFGFAARGMGRKPVWLAVTAGVGVSALLYILFKHGLSLSLPAGPIERFIDGIIRG